MHRKHISLKTKLAAALFALEHVPYEHAKLMTPDQIISLYHFDHGILHAIEPIDEFWNLTPRLIAPHKEKSRKDTSTVAKVVRIEKKWASFTKAMAEGTKPPKRVSRWPKRKMGNGRQFQKRIVKPASQ